MRCLDSSEVALQDNTIFVGYFSFLTAWSLINLNIRCFILPCDFRFGDEF